MSASYAAAPPAAAFVSASAFPTQKFPVFSTSKPIYAESLSSALADWNDEILEQEVLNAEADRFNKNEPEKSYTFSPHSFIDQFQHNDTHVNLTNGNQTTSLSWQDELVKP